MFIFKLRTFNLDILDTIVSIKRLHLRDKKKKDVNNKKLLKRMNIKKQKEYKKATTKVLYIIFIYINLLNTNFIKEFIIIKEKRK